jgi:hypothetical protein
LWPEIYLPTFRNNFPLTSICVGDFGFCLPGCVLVCARSLPLLIIG